MLFTESPRRPWRPYLLALLAFTIAVAARWFFFAALGARAPFVTLTPAVLFAVLFGGLPAGFLVTILSCLFVIYCWHAPVSPLVVHDAPDWVALVVFLLSCLLVCWLSEVTRRAQRRAFEAEGQLKLASEREQATAALREQLASIAATVPGVIHSFRIRPDGSSSMPYASAALEQIYGVQPAEVANDAALLFALIQPEDVEAVRLSIAESTRTLSPWHDEFRVNHPSRGEIWVEGHSVPQREPDGSTLWQGFISDVTARKLSEAALRDASEFSRQIINGAEEGFIVYGLDLTFQVWNPYMEQLTGLPASEVLGRHPAEVFSFLEHSGLLGMLERALQGEAGALEFAYYSTHKERTCWVSDRFTPLRNARGEIIGVIGLISEVSERHKAEEELRGSEARFRTLVEQAADAIFVHGRDGRFTDVNRRACESLGYPREELLQLSVFDIDEERTLENTQRVWDQIQQGQHLTLRGRQKRKDGSTFPVEVRLGSYLENGEILYLALARDMSERECREEQIRETSRRLELATTSAGFGVWDLDVAAGTLVWNERMFELYGVSPGDFDGTRAFWSACLHPGDRDRVLAAGNAALEGSQDFDVEFRVVAADGKVKTLKGEAVVVRDAQGCALRMIGLNRDITRQRSLEAQLLQAQKMEAVGRLAGGVAHDFNNNLTVILGYAELSKLVQLSGATYHEYLDQIIKAAEHSRDITQQLLAFSRNEIIAPRQVDLNQLIRQTEKTLSRLIGEDVCLNMTTPEGIWPVLIDPAQVNQIIINLAVNARDAMPVGGTLSIETRNLRIDEVYCLSSPEAVPGEYVQLTVSDTGVGMDRETLGHIFEPFFTTKGVGKGTGLGLATVYGIVSQNDGFLEVSSEPGQGAAFALFLPRMIREAGSQVEAAPVPGAGEGAVLLVEDEANVRQMAQLMLENAGFSVLAASSPSEALDLCRRPELRIDALLTDVIMPEMNGVQLSGAVRELRPGIGIVYMSGYTADMIQHHGVLAPGVIFIQKPFDMNSLNEKLQEAIRYSRPA